MSDETPTAKVVRLLGEDAIAKACGLTAQAVRKWPSHVPSRHQPTVYKLAIEVGRPLTAAELLGVEG